MRYLKVSLFLFPLQAFGAGLGMWVANLADLSSRYAIKAFFLCACMRMYVYVCICSKSYLITRKIAEHFWCVCVCVCVCMHVYMHTIYIYTCTRTYVYVYTYISILYTCIHIHMHMFTYDTCMYAYAMYMYQNPARGGFSSNNLLMWSKMFTYVHVFMHMLCICIKILLIYQFSYIVKIRKLIVGVGRAENKAKQIILRFPQLLTLALL
jgi:hypothetical protein